MVQPCGMDRRGQETKADNVSKPSGKETKENLYEWRRGDSIKKIEHESME